MRGIYAERVCDEWASPQTPSHACQRRRQCFGPHIVDVVDPQEGAASGDGATATRDPIDVLELRCRISVAVMMDMADMVQAMRAAVHVVACAPIAMQPSISGVGERRTPVGSISVARGRAIVIGLR